MRSTRASIALVVLAGCLAGCSSDVEDATPIGSWVGSTIQQLEESLPADTAYVVYDVSLPVVDKEPRYGTAGGGTNDRWIIVASCGEQTQLAVAVLNVEDYTDRIGARATKRDFDGLLTECSPTTAP
ncbi:hypothetical protein [Microbacterium sp. NPDC089696]|uniref:hypothetical protein n=1 Tax=Microbacterium sp. NPDC089696 TaxID=3364199 RepID=UPI0038172E7D